MNNTPGMQKRTMVAEDLQHIAVLSSESTSADGKHLAYVTTRINWEENIHKDFISILNLRTGTEEKVWEGSTPQWSPVADEVAYLASHQGKNYIWVYSLLDDSKRPLAPVYESNYFMGHLSLFFLQRDQ